MKIKVKRLCDEAILPYKATQGAAGYDLCSIADTVIPCNRVAVIRTGLQMDIPDGYHVEVRSRSGMAAKHQVFVLNSPGTVDSDYLGEVCVILFNAGLHDFHILKGDRIAQAVIRRNEDVCFVEVDEIIKHTERGSGGFGSTGQLSTL